MLDLVPHNPYGLPVRTPVIAAAGSLGYGVEAARLLQLGAKAHDHGLGALITRTVTLHPQRVGPLPRIVETPAGLLYSGIHYNPGLRYLVTRYAPVWAEWELPVIVSIAGGDAAEVAEVAAGLEAVPGVAGVEINLMALPMRLVEAVARLVAQVRAATLLPLLVKLPLDAPDLVPLAQAVAEAGADLLDLGTALPGLWLEPQSGEIVTGYLCGPALRPLALARLAELARAVDLPIIAGGGIASAADARQFLRLGASAVTLGAVLLTDPRASLRIASEIAMSEAGL